MGVATISVYSAASAASTDPRVEAQDLAQELQGLLSNPDGNKSLITQLEKQLRVLITSNPGVFSDLEKTDALNFCDDIEDYYMIPVGDPQVLGAVSGWLQNLTMDLAQGMSPIIPAISKEVLEDLDQMALDMNASPPNMADLEKCLADLEKNDPKGLPSLLEEKIQAAINAVKTFIANPGSGFDKGAAIAMCQSTLYALWVCGPR